MVQALIIIQILALMALGIVIFTKIPKSKTVKKSESRKALLDSCALIDGRIVELAQAGFVPSNLEVPEFIIAELQLLADGNDAQKRERARYGLEIVQRLQQIKGTKVTINRDKMASENLTDDKLVKLAKKSQAHLFTTDFNLNQVASIEGVRVLNVNELAHALRPVILPGEVTTIKVLQIGSSKDQGVGYLDDGTMVVIDGAKQDIGRSIEAKITRSHQTVAGRMLFATKVDNRPKSSKATKKVQSKVGRSSQANREKVQVQPRGNVNRSKNIKYQPKPKMTASEQKLFEAIDKQ